MDKLYCAIEPKATPAVPSPIPVRAPLAIILRVYLVGLHFEAVSGDQLLAIIICSYFKADERIVSPLHLPFHQQKPVPSTAVKVDLILQRNIEYWPIQC